VPSGPETLPAPTEDCTFPRCLCQPSSNARGTWTLSFARQRGQEIHEEAACAEYPLPQLSHLNISRLPSVPSVYTLSALHYP